MSHIINLTFFLLLIDRSKKSISEQRCLLLLILCALVIGHKNSSKIYS